MNLATYRKHFVGLVEDEHLHVVGLQDTSLNHVVNSSRGTHNDLRTILEGLHILANICAANASMAFNVHEIADGNDNLLNLLSKLTGWRKDESLAGLEVRVDLLKAGDGKGGSLAGTRLCLGNDIRS